MSYIKRSDYVKRAQIVVFVKNKKWELQLAVFTMQKYLVPLGLFQIISDVMGLGACANFQCK